MNVIDAQHLLGMLENLGVEKVRVVVQLPQELKIGEFIPAMRAEGYAAFVQSSVHSDAEVVVTERNANIGLARR